MFRTAKGKMIFGTLLSVMTINVFAQGLTGKVVDKNGLPVPFVNVMWLAEKDSVFERGAVSKEDGTFSFDTDAKEGILKFSCIGFRTVFHKVPSQKEFVTVTMEDSGNEIKEIVVKGSQTYKKTNEGTLVNVAGTAFGKLGTATDVLGYVPGIVKKKEGFEVFGKGNTVIYINNRKLYNVEELENLKSSDIKSVEIIQNPGSSYDAAVNAVIKIKTMRMKGEGMGVSLSSNYSYNDYHNTDQQIGLNYRKNGLNLFAEYKYTHTNRVQHSFYDQTTQVDVLWKQHNEDKHRTSTEQHEVTGGFSYDIDPANSFGARYTLTATPFRKRVGTVESEILANGLSYDKISTSNVSSNADSPSHLLNMYYNGKWGKTAIEFNSDLYFDKRKEHDTYNEKAVSHESRDIEADNRVDNQMVALKLVLSTPLGKGNVKYGAEYVHTNRTDDYAINRTDLIANTDSRLKEQTYSPFVEYGCLTPIGQVSAGVRYEYVKFDYYADGIHQPSQSRTYHNVFPYLSLGTRLGNVMTQLSYSVKTERPTYEQLSNNVTYLNRFTLQTGNPLLKNALTHTVEWSGMWRILQFMVNYKDSRNAIIYWADQSESNEAVTVVNHKNQHSIKSMTMYLSASPRFGIWTPVFSAGMVKQWLKLQTHLGNYTLNDPVFFAGVKNMITLPFHCTFNADFNFQSKGHATNYRITKERYELNVGLSKSWLQDRLIVEVKGNDLLKAKDSGMLYNPKMQLHQDSWYGTRNVMLTLRYKFNMTKSQYKGEGAGNEAKSRM